MIRRPPRSTPLYSSAASDVYKRQVAITLLMGVLVPFMFWNTMIGFVVYVHHTHVKVSWHDERTAWSKAQPFVLSLIHISEPTRH